MRSPVLFNRRRMLTSAFTALAASALVPLVRTATEPSSASARKIAVTIDDGPVTGAGRNLEAFERISAGLRDAFVEEQVPAIMFVNEKQLHVPGQRDARVAVLEKWIDAGLDLGNHTFSHPRLTDLEVWQYTDDILKGEVITRLLLQERRRKLVWFRYPFLASGRGDVARAVEAFLAERNYRIAPVTVDYGDFRFAGPYARNLRSDDKQQAEDYYGLVFQAMDEAFERSERLSREVLGRDLPQILLIHCNEMNSLKLRATLQRIRARGYTFISLDEAMSDPAYQQANMAPGGLGGGGWFHSLAAAIKEAQAP